MAPSEIVLNPQLCLDPFAVWYGRDSGEDLPRLASVPKGWPLSLDSPMAWSGGQFQGDHEYTYVLDEFEKIEIENALQSFKRATSLSDISLLHLLTRKTDLGLDGNEANESNFPLPTLQGRLRKLAAEVHEGRGFFVLRGLDPRKYTIEDNCIIFLGVSSLIGEKRGKQDDDGRMLCS